MTSDSGLTSQETDYARHIQEVLSELQQIQQSPRLVNASFVPVMDATLKGPDVVFALLCTYLQRLEITQADHVLFIADGAAWIWKRVPLLVQA